MNGNIGPNPEDPNSPLYQFIDTQPLSSYPNERDSSPSHFTTRQLTPTAITATLPIVVTVPAHGLINGQAVRATQFIAYPTANATGMLQLNLGLFYVQQCTTDTFQLYDVYGFPVDGINFTPYVSGGQFTASGPEILVVNPSLFPPPGIVIPMF